VTNGGIYVCQKPNLLVLIRHEMGDKFVALVRAGRQTCCPAHTELELAGRQTCCPGPSWVTNLSPNSCQIRTKKLGHVWKNCAMISSSSFSMDRHPSYAWVGRLGLMLGPSPSWSRKNTLWVGIIDQMFVTVLVIVDLSRRQRWQRDLHLRDVRRGLLKIGLILGTRFQNRKTYQLNTKCTKGS
jgi:hypothetical protein